jgi:hypothetical protein
MLIHTNNPFTAGKSLAYLTLPYLAVILFRHESGTVISMRFGLVRTAKKDLPYALALPLRLNVNRLKHRYSNRVCSAIICNAPDSGECGRLPFRNALTFSPFPEIPVTAVDYRSSLHQAKSPQQDPGMRKQRSLPPITLSQSPWSPQVRPPSDQLESTQSRDPDTRLQPTSPYPLSLHLDPESRDTWQGSSGTLVESPGTSTPLPWGRPDGVATGMGSPDTRDAPSTFRPPSSSDSPFSHLEG